MQNELSGLVVVLITQTIVYSTLKLQNDFKVDILVNHKKHLGLGRNLLRQPKLSLAQMPPSSTYCVNQYTNNTILNYNI